MSPEQVLNTFKQLLPPCEFWTLRIVRTEDELLQVRQNILQPPMQSHSYGAHITLVKDGGIAYSATSALSREGLNAALAQANAWCEHVAGKLLLQTREIPRPSKSGGYQSLVAQPWEECALADKVALLQDASGKLKIHDNIMDWEAQLLGRRTQVFFYSSDGVEIEQVFHYMQPGYYVVANKGSQTQMRSGGGWGTLRQGGMEQLTDLGFHVQLNQVAEQALALLDAPECPGGEMSLLLMPSQMMLQIHESIGHPLELDRILGDERNYAGTSFVTPDMFGHYQYGSELLNVSANDPLAAESASFAFDDEGTPSQKELIIHKGVLQRPLGGLSSQLRSNMPGVATARASDWNRPAMDRMSNLNVEPGDQSFTQLLSGIERGVLMDTNKSWSIDDSRNKFQFGCELGRIIKDGELKGIVRNPNYRGISANFWRSLSAVGDRDSFEIWGTPYCGKGEPNQMVHVGHASPACVFEQVAVFGGV